MQTGNCYIWKAPIIVTLCSSILITSACSSLTAGKSKETRIKIVLFRIYGNPLPEKKAYQYWIFCSNSWTKGGGEIGDEQFEKAAQPFISKSVPDEYMSEFLNYMLEQNIMAFNDSKILQTEIANPARPVDAIILETPSIKKVVCGQEVSPQHQMSFQNIFYSILFRLGKDYPPISIYVEKY